MNFSFDHTCSSCTLRSLMRCSRCRSIGMACSSRPDGLTSILSWMIFLVEGKFWVNARLIMKRYHSCEFWCPDILNVEEKVENLCWIVIRSSSMEHASQVREDVFHLPKITIWYCVDKFCDIKENPELKTLCLHRQYQVWNWDWGWELALEASQTFPCTLGLHIYWELYVCSRESHLDVVLILHHLLMIRIWFAMHLIEHHWGFALGLREESDSWGVLLQGMSSQGLKNNGTSFQGHS